MEISFNTKKKDNHNFFLEILKLICNGYSNDKIAKKLFISSRTVESHKANLILKTKTHNTINLVIYALKNEIIEL